MLLKVADKVTAEPNSALPVTVSATAGAVNSTGKNKLFVVLFSPEYCARTIMPNCAIFAKSSLATLKKDLIFTVMVYLPFSTKVIFTLSSKAA